jgi:hypothetical protein
MNSQKETLKKIAKRNVLRLKNNGITNFDLLNKFVNIYDKSSKEGMDRKLAKYMLKEIGYKKSKSAGWILEN